MPRIGYLRFSNWFSLVLEFIITKHKTLDDDSFLYDPFQLLPL